MKGISYTGVLMALSLGLAPSGWAQVPQTISYQGKVSAYGTNFSGTGQFKFAIVSAGGAQSFWSNDGTSSAGSPPASAVSLPVSNGLFNVMLGDTSLRNMTEAIPPSIFQVSGLRLRLWFNGGVSGFQQLSPDQPFGSVGYAMYAADAARAESVATGAAVKQVVTGAGLAGGPITDQGTISIPSGGVVNSMLAQSTVNVTAGSGLGGGGTVALGSSVSLSANLNHNATLAGNGGSTVLGLNLGNANLWTGTQTFLGLGGNGSGLTNVNADFLGGFAYCSLPCYWKLTGNGGTTAGVNFLGTTDNMPLEIKVNQQRAFRFEPTTNSPNVIGGFSGNYVLHDVVGSTIAGGGTTYRTNFIDIGAQWFSGLSLPSFSTIGGGLGNEIVSNGKSTIAGGSGNGIRSPGIYYEHNTIGGGASNHVNVAMGSTVAGGQDNTISGDSGGFYSYATIGGGKGNVIDAYLDNGNGPTVAGGQSNRVNRASDYGTVGGGVGNVLAAFCSGATIGGGARNYVSGRGEFLSHHGTIAGGLANTNSAKFASIGGGLSNVVNGIAATVPGGLSNTATNYAFAAGRRAKAAHQGAFVWADSTDADFSSSAANELAVRASGGINAETYGQGIWLDSSSTRMHVGRTGSYGSANGFTFDPGNIIDGLIIEQGVTESSGIYLDGDFISMWSPGDQNRLLRIYDEDGMVEKFYIDGSGNAVANGVILTSARRFKENVEPISDALDKVSHLQGVTFDWVKERGGGHGIGFVAEDVAEVLPELVTWEDGASGRQAVGVQYANVTAVTIEAIKELKSVVEEKEQRIQTLERELAELKAVVKTLH